MRKDLVYWPVGRVLGEKAFVIRSRAVMQIGAGRSQANGIVGWGMTTRQMHLRNVHRRHCLDSKSYSGRLGGWKPELCHAGSFKVACLSTSSFIVDS
jgi:hypothetical protein